MYYTQNPHKVHLKKQYSYFVQTPKDSSNFYGKGYWLLTVGEKMNLAKLMQYSGLSQTPKCWRMKIVLYLLQKIETVFIQSKCM